MVKGQAQNARSGVSSGTITINNVAISVTYNNTSNAQNRAAVVSAINQYVGQTGVTAVDTGTDSGGVKLVAGDGRNIDITYTT